MSVWIYKDGEKELIAPEYLEGQLEAGWSVTEGSVIAVEEAPVVETKPDIASDAFFKMSNQDIRDKAQAAGIKDSDKLRIHTLKEMLE